jgi:hypothetical protein
VHLVILVALALAASACSDRVFFAPVDGFAHHEPDERYEALFPYYVELCAVSQLRSDELLTGGSPGHAAMYLKGACRDEDAPYPKLRRCARHATDPDDREHGAGISVNRWFRNVNWMAVSGRGMFFDGGLEPDEVVTRARFEEVAPDAIDAGVFHGVELWPWPARTPDADFLEWVTYRSAGTDFAVRLARSSLCGRLPVEPEMLDEIIDFLNDLNREYATGAKRLPLERLPRQLRPHAAQRAGGGERRGTDLGAPHEAAPALPPGRAGERGDLARGARHDGPGGLVSADLPGRPPAQFPARVRLAPRHGALLVSLPVHTTNELFDQCARMLVFQGPATMRTTRRLLEMLEDPRFTELDANLAHFGDVYREILAAKEERDPMAALWGDRYRRIRRRYTALIEAELREVEQMQAASGVRPETASASPTSPD